jgi:hypothetical protein
LRAPSNFSINAYQMFAVGGVDASGYPNAPYPIASWSGRGPTPCAPADPDNIKPEIVAPGIDIYTCSGTLISGHSFAEAHVAGVIALMREACSDCDYITIKAALMNTAIDEGAAGEDNTYGHGFVDAFAAVLAVMPWGRCCYGGGSCVDVTLPECEALNGEWTQGVSCVTGCLESIDNLTAYATGGDVVLRWSAVPFATFYRIYTSPTSEEPWTLLDSTTATVYTHVGAAEPRLSYDVRACSQ